eukprot:GGOE01014576.1.p1 GENE.GGOE01014576.1~~GGOE01014576.1.p1  ORF type:complete len:447 (-),score=149.00 GGOE01014576.1:437-1777(-)
MLSSPPRATRGEGEEESGAHQRVSRMVHTGLSCGDIGVQVVTVCTSCVLLPLLLFATMTAASGSKVAVVAVVLVASLLCGVRQLHRTVRAKLRSLEQLVGWAESTANAAEERWDKAQAGVIHAKRCFDLLGSAPQVWAVVQTTVSAFHTSLQAGAIPTRRALCRRLQGAGALQDVDPARLEAAVDVVCRQVEERLQLTALADAADDRDEVPLQEVAADSAKMLRDAEAEVQAVATSAQQQGEGALHTAASLTADQATWAQDRIQRLEGWAAQMQEQLPTLSQGESSSDGVQFVVGLVERAFGQAKVTPLRQALVASNLGVSGMEHLVVQFITDMALDQVVGLLYAIPVLLLFLGLLLSVPFLFLYLTDAVDDAEASACLILGVCGLLLAALGSVSLCLSCGAAWLLRNATATALTSAKDRILGMQRGSSETEALKSQTSQPTYGAI